MNKKTNGNGKKSGNGHDKDTENIVHLPTLAQRDRARKNKLKAEERQKKQAQKSAQPPFINLEKITPFIRVLALALVTVHLVVYLGFDDGQRLKAFYTLGFLPAAFTGGFDYHWYSPLTLITHMFIHGSWMHLAFNLVMTLALGILFERQFGSRTTVIFFFACGVAGAAVYFILNPFSTTPVIGASGGISGLFGAALILMHQRKQFGQINTKLNDPGPWKIIGFWIILMIVIGLISGPGIAWQAHLGGFIAGVALLKGLQTGRVRF